MTKPPESKIEKQRQALKQREDQAYAALKEAEDELFQLEDRVERRGDRVSVEGL
jgi:coproporphyrinogen III oxidase